MNWDIVLETFGWISFGRRAHGVLEIGLNIVGRVAGHEFVLL